MKNIGIQVDFIEEIVITELAQETGIEVEFIEEIVITEVAA